MWKCRNCESEWAGVNVEGIQAFLCPSCGAKYAQAKMYLGVLIESSFKLIHSDMPPEEIQAAEEMPDYWQFDTPERIGVCRSLSDYPPGQRFFNVRYGDPNAN